MRKECSKCKVKKESSLFRIGRATCKECISAAQKEHRNKPEVKDRQNSLRRAKYTPHPVQRVTKSEKLAKIKEWQKKNPDKVKEYAKKSRNRSVAKEIRTMWIANNKDRFEGERDGKYKETQKKRHERHRDELSDYYVKKMLLQKGITDPTSDIIEAQRIRVEYQRFVKEMERWLNQQQQEK